MGLTDFFRPSSEYEDGEKIAEDNDNIIFLKAEIEYLAEEIRKLEIENHELRQEIQLYETLIHDIQTGTPKGGIN